MAKSRKKLTFFQRSEARRIARQVYTDPQLRTEEQRKLAFDDRASRQGLDPATIFLLIQIAIKLWQWWSDNKVSNPKIFPTEGEPE